MEKGRKAMRNLLARCLGIRDKQDITPETLMVLIERHSSLSRSEAHALALHYLGRTAVQIAAELQISPDTVKTYWKRASRKLGVRGRAALHAWVEQLVQTAVS
jgi:DNA-binding CsgD family transcriptional regulator